MESKGKKSSSVIIPVVFGTCLISLVYFGVANFQHTSDGLIAALRMRETAVWFIHPNHPLHPFLPHLIYRLIGGVQSGISELELLQFWSNIAGVIGCLALMVALSVESNKPATILTGIALFAFSNGIWFFYVAANPQSTALTPHIIAVMVIALFLKRQRVTLRISEITILSIFTVFAILASQLNAVLILPSCFLIFLSEQNASQRVRKILIFLVFVSFFTGLLFVLFASIFVGVRTPAELLNWQHSYVFNDRWWASGFVDALQRNWVGLIKSHLASVFDSYGLFGPWDKDGGILYLVKRLSFGLSQIVVLLFLVIETVRAFIDWIKSRPKSLIQTIGLLAFIPMLLFSIVWVPETYHYRILYIPGYFLFLMPWLEKKYFPGKFNMRQAWPVILIIIALFSNNFALNFLPKSDPGNNVYVYETLLLDEYIKPGDLIIYDGTDVGEARALHARYFLNCDAILIDDLLTSIEENPDELTEDLRARKENGALMLIHEDVLVTESDMLWINREVFAELTEGELSELLDSWAIPLGLFDVINDRKYFQFEPK